MNLENKLINCNFRTVDRDDDGHPRSELFYKCCTKYTRSIPCKYLRVNNNKQFCSYETTQHNR